MAFAWASIVVEGRISTEYRDLEACVDQFGETRCAEWSSSCADNVMVRQHCRLTCRLCGRNTTLRPVWVSFDIDGDGMCTRDEVKSALRRMADERKIAWEEIAWSDSGKPIGPFACEALATEHHMFGHWLSPNKFWEDLMCKSCLTHDELVEEPFQTSAHAASQIHLKDNQQSVGPSQSLLVAIPVARRGKHRDAMVLHALHELSVLAMAGKALRWRFGCTLSMHGTTC